MSCEGPFCCPGQQRLASSGAASRTSRRKSGDRFADGERGRDCLSFKPSGPAGPQGRRDRQGRGSMGGVRGGFTAEDAEVAEEKSESERRMSGCLRILCRPWNQFRRGGARVGQTPTNAEYGAALEASLRAGGLSPAEAASVAAQAAQQRAAYGLAPNAPVPRIPGRINQTPPPP